MTAGARLVDLTDGTIRLRRWRYDDLACLREASREGVIPQGTTVPSVWSDVAGREFVARQRRREVDGQGWSRTVVPVGAPDRGVGCVVLLHRRQAGVAGVGYWLEPSARGHGLAARAVALVTRWGLTVGGLSRVEAWVEPENDASVATLLRCGFVAEGRLRSFLTLGDRRVDALVFSRVRADLDATPAG